MLVYQRVCDSDIHWKDGSEDDPIFTSGTALEVATEEAVLAVAGIFWWDFIMVNPIWDWDIMDVICFFSWLLWQFDAIWLIFDI
jgi:hypothetical protein